MDVLQFYDKQLSELVKGKREQFDIAEFICDLVTEQRKINSKLKALQDKEDLTPADRLMITTYEMQGEQIKRALDMASNLYPKKFPMY